MVVPILTLLLITVVTGQYVVPQRGQLRTQPDGQLIHQRQQQWERQHIGQAAGMTSSLTGKRTMAPSACDEPLHFGACRQRLIRWFFNPNTGRCMMFFYSGCGGNGNNFPSLRQCLAVCAGKPRGRNPTIKSIHREQQHPHSEPGLDERRLQLRAEEQPEQLNIQSRQQPFAYARRQPPRVRGHVHIDAPRRHMQKIPPAHALPFRSESRVIPNHNRPDRPTKPRFMQHSRMSPNVFANVETPNQFADGNVNVALKQRQPSLNRDKAMFTSQMRPVTSSTMEAPSRENNSPKIGKSDKQSKKKTDKKNGRSRKKPFNFVQIFVQHAQPRHVAPVHHVIHHKVQHSFLSPFSRLFQRRLGSPWTLHKKLLPTQSTPAESRTSDKGIKDTTTVPSSTTVAVTTTTSVITTDEPKVTLAGEVKATEKLRSYKTPLPNDVIINAKKESPRVFNDETKVSSLLSRSPVKFHGEMQYVSVIVIMCIVGVTIIGLSALTVMFLFRRLSHQTTKKERVIEAVVQAQLYQDLPKLAGPPDSSA